MAIEANITDSNIPDSDILISSKIESLAVEIENLKNQLRYRDQQISTLTHEIRTPLNIIIGMLNDISNKKKSVTVQNQINYALQASSHLLDVVNNVLSISKTLQNNAEIQIRPFNLENMVVSLKKFFLLQAREKGLDLEFILPTEFPVLFIGDDSQLRQVLINLTGNAIKFTSKGKVLISIAVVRENQDFDRVYFEIQDTGSGIDSDFLDKVFEPFSRENSKFVSNVEGSGLGLHISKNIIEKMQGDISIKSEKNKGTTVKFNVLLKSASISDFSLKISSKAFISLKEKKILVVDDNELILGLTSRTLKAAGAEVTEADNGVEALKLLVSNSFDLILIDIQMSVIDGIETCSLIRNIFRSKVPVVALTANASENDLIKCSNAGINEVFIKPMKDEYLIEKISKILETDYPSFCKDELFNLEILKKDSDKDEEFEKRMISIFIDSAVKTLEILNKSNSEPGLIKNAAHKLLPSVQSLGSKILVKRLKWIEIQTDFNSIEYYRNIYIIQLILQFIVKELHQY
jgi:CheY-like chemotaxis protein